MGAIASQNTSLTIVYSIIYSDADQRKHQSSASLAFVRGIHRGPVNSPHKWPVMRKMFPFDDVIMLLNFIKYKNKWHMSSACIYIYIYIYIRVLGCADFSVPAICRLTLLKGFFFVSASVVEFAEMQLPVMGFGLRWNGKVVTLTV